MPQSEKKTKSNKPNQPQKTVKPHNINNLSPLPLSPYALKEGPPHAANQLQRQSSFARLQNKVGNRAATQFLQRRQTDTSLLHTAGNAPNIQREDELDRSWLIQRIAFRMGLAFDKYVDAANSKKKSIQDAAKAQAEMFGLFLDIVLTFAAPGIGKLVTSAISKGVAAEAPLIVYKLADKAIDSADQIVSSTLAVGKKGVSQGVDAILKEGETEKFIDTLKEGFSVVLDSTHASLPSKSDEDLAILYTNFDPSIATKSHYLTQIDKIVGLFQRQVDPIGDYDLQVSQAHIRKAHKWATWIKYSDTSYLALVEHSELTTFGTKKGYKFLNWIGNDMKDIAIAKTEKMTGKNITEIPKADVEKIP